MATRRLAHALFCLLGLCPLGVFSQESADIEATILQPSPFVWTRGANSTLSCVLNRDLSMFLTHSVSWLKQSRARGPLMNDTTVISTNDVFSSAVDPQRFHVETTDSNKSVTVTLHIKNVENEDEGRYVCQVTTIQHSIVTSSAEIDVYILDDQLLKVDERVSEGSIKVTPGPHTVQCFIEGLDTEAVMDGVGMSLYLGHHRLTPIRVNNSRALAPENLVWAEATVYVSEADDGKTLSCEVEKSGRGANTTLIVVAKPSVHCDDVRVRHSDMHVTLDCVVTHANVTLHRFEWEHDTFSSREGPASNNASVTEEMSDTQTRVSRRLDVVQWDDTRHPFTLTAFTDAGKVSGDADVIVEDYQGGEDDDHHHGGGDGDGGGNGGTTRAHSVSKMMWNQAVLVVVVVVFLQC